MTTQREGEMPSRWAPSRKTSGCGLPRLVSSMETMAANSDTAYPSNLLLGCIGSTADPGFPDPRVVIATHAAMKLVIEIGDDFERRAGICCLRLNADTQDPELAQPVRAEIAEPVPFALVDSMIATLTAARDRARSEGIIH